MISRKFFKQLKKETFFKNINLFSAQRPPIEIFIDNQPYKVDPGYTIWQACYESGVVIPRFCYHERLAIAGNCRMCLVEVEKSPKPVASCAAQVMPGMRILTQSEKTRIHRGAVMEFILANHPLDCPICDQGGECDLQDISEIYGYNDSRMYEYKHAFEDKNLGPLVSTSMNRCIVCTRCTRFADEIAGMPILGKTGRGGYSEIGTYISKMVDSELSGNLVDLCPVGALTNAPYSFTSRPWELKSYDSVDIFDSTGSAIQIDTRGSEVMRVLPRIHEEINEEWISDKTRHAFDGLKQQRLKYPLQRQQDGSFNELKWDEVFSSIREKLLNTPGDQIAAIIGEFADVESIVALKDLLNRFDCDNFEIRQNQQQILSPNLRSEYIMNSSIQGIEDSDLILLVGTNPRFEAPVLNSRIMRSTRKNNAKVAVIGTPQELLYDYMHLGISTKTLSEIANGSHPFSERLKKAKLPSIIVGSSVFQRQDGEQIQNDLKKICQNTPVVDESNFWNGYNVLHRERSTVGALDVGLNLSSDLKKKDIKFVFILGCDNNINKEDIPEDAFVVYLGTHGDEGVYFADIILPGAAYTEKTSTFVNTEGRVQLTHLVVQPPGFAKEDWQIIRALSEEVGQALPYDTIEELRYRIAELAPHLLKYDYIEPTQFGNIALQPNQNQKDSKQFSPITDSIENFYMTDAISRNSTVMAKCSTAFNSIKFNNFKRNKLA